MRAYLFLSALILGLVSGCAGPISVQVLAINDFHGNLIPPNKGWTVGEQKVPAGGAAHLAAHLAEHRSQNPNTVVVSAGDLIGASPLISGLFHDEPTIEAMNAIGLDFNAVGNHEFDEGPQELMRMKKGGCHPKDGCFGEPFEGAKFTFLAANVRKKGQAKTIFPPYVIRRFEGVPVAFIGMTLEGTPKSVPPVVDDLEFADEADTVNALVRELSGEVKTFVVIVHEGGRAKGGENACEGLSGDIVDIVDRLDPAVDAVVSGHTHQAYVCRRKRMLLTSAGSFGRLFTKIQLTLDPATGDVTTSSAKNIIVSPTGPSHVKAGVQTIVQRYQTMVAPLENREIGALTGPLPNERDEAGETVLGDVIADAHLFATRSAGAQVAFMNTRGLRAPIIPKEGKVTYGILFGTQPFGNLLITMTMTGAQIHELLEAQWTPGRVRVLQISSTLNYAWSAGQPPGKRVDPASIMIDGTPLVLDKKYRVTVNDYLATRGAFAKGTERVQGPIDVDGLQTYFKSASPVSPPKRGRIRRLP